MVYQASANDALIEAEEYASKLKRSDAPMLTAPAVQMADLTTQGVGAES